MNIEGCFIIMDLNQKPKKQGSFSSDIVDNEVILFNPDGSRFLYLNQSAALVWEQCTGVLSAKEIIQAMQEAFPDAVEKVQNDIENTLLTFLKHDCITMV